MPKTRAYTRDELKGLRRADLQRLCKTYDIKGANAKSEVLVETLATYFSSPAYLSSPRAEPAHRSRPSSRLHLQQHRPLHALAKRSNPPVKTNPSPAPVTVSAPPSVPAGGPAAIAAPSGVNQLLTMATDQDELATLRLEVSQLKETVDGLEKQQEIAISKLFDSKLAEFNATVARQLAIVDERETALKQREHDLAMAWEQLRERVNNATVARSSSLASVPGRSTQSTGKRKQVSDRMDFDDTRPAEHKRARLQTDSSPHTPPPSLPSELSSLTNAATSSLALPRTPSPGHQGTSVDHSRTPSVETRSLDCPVFGTTPRPPAPDPSSPTTDHFVRPDGPPALGSGSMGFRTSRSLFDRSARKFTRAQIDLTHITDDEQPEAFLKPILIRKDRTVTPPALSPSPSIGGDNFTYTPLPKPAAGGSSSAAAAAASSSAALAAVPRAKVTQHHARALSSPGREYMQIALNGLSNPNDTIVTPNSRTMLGTERYRDTRFGDEPDMMWGSPSGRSIDFGPPTPSH